MEHVSSYILKFTELYFRLFKNTPWIDNSCDFDKDIYSI